MIRGTVTCETLGDVQVGVVLSYGSFTASVRLTQSMNCPSNWDSTTADCQCGLLPEPIPLVTTWQRKLDRGGVSRISVWHGIAILRLLQVPFVVLGLFLMSYYLTVVPELRG